MTKFIDGSKNSEPKKIKKETVLTHFVDADKEIDTANIKLSEYDKIEFLFHDKAYGDVFKGWTDENPNDITLLFGTKGDEDYQ